MIKKICIIALTLLLCAGVVIGNEYFDFSTGRLSAGSIARSADVNSIFDSIETGLDKLPTESDLKRGLINYATDSGAADAYVVTLTYAPASYIDGMEVVFKAANTNTGASTINVNSLGVKSIRRQDGTVLLAGDLPGDKIITIRYNSESGYFEVQGGVSATGSGTMASQNASAVAITGGTISGITTLTASGELEGGSLDINGNADISGTLDVGSSTTRRVAPTGTFANNANGNPNISDTVYTMSGHTISTWESVGPTGSGADNTWTALDSVPSDADYIKIKAFISSGNNCGGTPENTYQMNAYVRKTGGSDSNNGTDNLIAACNAVATATSGCAKCQDTNTMEVPVDGSIRFDGYWYGSFTSTNTATLILVGWGFNP